MLSLAFQILEKNRIFVELYEVKGGYCSHRNIYYDFCIAGQERVKKLRKASTPPPVYTENIPFYAAYRETVHELGWLDKLGGFLSFAHRRRC